MPSPCGSFCFFQGGEEKIAKQKRVTGRTEIGWDPGQANPKQLEFFNSRTLYTAYGGAKGGGKTWAVRTKAIGGALLNPGIRILIMRCHYPELLENHVNPIIKAVPPELASYNGTSHLMTFENGSIIKFGHWSGDESENEYNGLEYDWIFIDEATQFSERAFNFLGGCLRGVNDFPKRMYLTCNPGGVGHNWVKRLFIDRDYRTYPDDPERDEHPGDYNFIFATVEDNTHLLESSPTYLKNLANMPEDLRRAYRYGDWNILGGNYFKELREDTHMVKHFKPPDHWERYRSFDYGLTYQPFQAGTLVKIPEKSWKAKAKQAELDSAYYSGTTKGQQTQAQSSALTAAQEAKSAAQAEAAQKKKIDDFWDSFSKVINNSANVGWYGGV